MLQLKIWGPHGPLLGKVGGPMGPERPYGARPLWGPMGPHDREAKKKNVQLKMKVYS